MAIDKTQEKLQIITNAQIHGSD